MTVFSRYVAATNTTRILILITLSGYGQAGADLEARDKRGWTALFHATYNGHQNVVKFLLDSGADINCAYVFVCIKIIRVYRYLYMSLLSNLLVTSICMLF